MTTTRTAPEVGAPPTPELEELEGSPATPSAGPDARRTLQLVLATFWLVDGILQLQAFFFTKSFGLQMISGMSSGNPPVIARPISWSGTLIGHHAVLTDSLFALVQMGIALSIAWRPAVKWGLAASIVWSAGVWWIGEGLGGVVNGTADPVNGAPGAVILYALVAVLLWPRDRAGPSARFIAARWVGEPVARAVWVVLWGSLAYLAVLGPHRSPRSLRDLIGAEAGGEPPWLASLDRHAASAVDHHGFVVCLALAALMLVVAGGVFLPPVLANVTLVVGAVIGLVIWVVGENFGALFTNGATDLNSGPLLILLVALYWRSPTRSGSARAARRRFLGRGAT